jgi:hypothetical protein
VTDTAEVKEMLDLAHRAWPEVTDRKQLLLRLAAAGTDSIRSQVDAHEQAQRRAQQIAAMSRAAKRMDVDLLLADAAWQ